MRRRRGRAGERSAPWAAVETTSRRAPATGFAWLWRCRGQSRGGTSRRRTACWRGWWSVLASPSSGTWHDGGSVGLYFARSALLLAPLTLMSLIAAAFVIVTPELSGLGFGPRYCRSLLLPVSLSLSSALIPVSAICHSSGLDFNEHYISVRNMFFVSVGSALSSPSRQ